MEKVKAVIFDLDGTLSDCTHRNHYLEKTPIDLDSFDALMHTDTVIAPIAFLLKNLSGVIKIVLTARPDKYRKVTEKWLSDYKLLSHIKEIYMRPNEWDKKPYSHPTRPDSMHLPCKSSRPEPWWVWKFTLSCPPKAKTSPRLRVWPIQTVGMPRRTRWWILSPWPCPEPFQF